ncbi:DUF721 domain-containing protein [Mangrovibacterium marinum]|uniref:Uncharacterized protein DUF721 n=1 Tax=Mangrovibacterium marinum TaxID=1639118 RepID=A0A2T5BYE1_9BACT|nr:DUF721 domain-containing protein [Mangrovibacterium marinum]PTN06802.1 uncharacterized protein DUF721 [Mangrovibacterium marinum]
MRKSNTEKISEVLKQYVEQNRLQSKLSEVDIVTSWERLMGKTVASYTEDIRITSGTLFIKLRSPILKNELIMMREQIKKHLNDEAGAEVIRQIVFQ